MKRIVISSDHAGFSLKQSIKDFLNELDYEVEDVGTGSTEPVDYPELTRLAAEKVASGEFSKGIIFCGTGQGDAMVANKVPGVRAALCWDTFTAEMSRAHNDANVLVIGGWLVGVWLAREIVRVWLSTPFEGGRHERRIEQMMAIEAEGRMFRSEVYDVTVGIKSGMPVWPGNSPVTRKIVKSIDRGDSSNVSMYRLGTHTGTHVDAPRHFLPSSKGVDSLSLDALTGKARLFRVPEAHHIDRKVLEGLDLSDISRVLLSTRNSALQNRPQIEPDYAYVSKDAAEYLLKKGVKLVGVDYLSIEEYGKEGKPTHVSLLRAGVVILEGLDLSSVPEGDYELICLPLKLLGADGAPARVLLRAL